MCGYLFMTWFWYMRLHFQLFPFFPKKWKLFICTHVRKQYSTKEQESILELLLLVVVVVKVNFEEGNDGGLDW